jgi:hypothetical protein
MREIRSHRGATLWQLSMERPTLVVFLRHAGCVFCREALADLSRQRAAIEGAGVRLALVHMSEPLNATLRCERYALGDVHRYCDRQCCLYDAFGLPRVSLRQLLNPRVWGRAVVAGLLRGYGFGRTEGDSLRLSGVFLLYQGQIHAEHRAVTVADRPDYLHIARSGCAAAGYRCGPSDGRFPAARKPA